MTEERRVTPEMMEKLIVDTQYHHFPETTVIICCLTLKNGFNVIGQAACVSEDLFNEKIGKGIAYDNAFEKIWNIEGYLLKQRIYEEAQ